MLKLRANLSCSSPSPGANQARSGGSRQRQSQTPPGVGLVGLGEGSGDAIHSVSQVLERADGHGTDSGRDHGRAAGFRLGDERHENK